MPVKKVLIVLGVLLVCLVVWRLAVATPFLGALIPAGSLQSSATTGNYVTLPPDYPAITVTMPAKGTAPGLLFVAPFTSTVFATGHPLGRLIMLDNTGQPVYYRDMPNGLAMDFKVLPDGTLSYFDWNRQLWQIMDNSYRPIATVKPGNGLKAADEHELQRLKNGHYLIMADQDKKIDMSKVVAGGKPNTDVSWQVIQEVDAAGTVYFSWSVLDHAPLTDTNQSLTTPPVDYSHCNAVEPDTDGNLLLSCRHLDSITKINRATGAIMWHLGGRENNFTFTLGAGLPITETLNFNWQHDIRRQPNGDITLFDNHDGPGPLVSRVLEYKLDEQHLTATLVRALHHSPNTYSNAMGDGQRLPNGDTLVGWGLNTGPALTEFRPDGTMVLDMRFGNSLVSYRAFRFPWTGHPTWPPALVVQPSQTGLQLAFSWNGATDVASYRVYGGNSSPPTTLLGTAPKAGFETSVQLSGAQAAYGYYEVVPLDPKGQAGAASNVARNTRAQ